MINNKTKPEQYCGVRPFSLSSSHPANNICKEHDEAYEIGFSSYWQVLKADARFTGRMLFDAGRMLIGAIVFPPIVLVWGAWRWSKFRKYPTKS